MKEGRTIKNFVRRLGRDDRQLRLMARTDQRKAERRGVDASSGAAWSAPTSAGLAPQDRRQGQRRIEGSTYSNGTVPS